MLDKKRDVIRDMLEHHLVKQFGPTEEIRIYIWRLCDKWPY